MHVFPEKNCVLAKPNSPDWRRNTFSYRRMPALNVKGILWLEIHHFAALDEMIMQVRIFNGYRKPLIEGLMGTVITYSCRLLADWQGSAVEVSGCHHLDSMSALHLTFDGITELCEDPDMVQDEVAVSPMKYFSQQWTYSCFSYNFYLIGYTEARGTT